MAKIEDMITNDVKSNVYRKVKHAERESENFVGQPDQVMNAGFNADGSNLYSSVDGTTEPSKTQQFLTQNKDLLTGLFGAGLGALTGTTRPAGTTTQPTYYAPEPEKKNKTGMYIGIAIAVILLIILIVWLVKRKK